MYQRPQSCQVHIYLSVKLYTGVVIFGSYAGQACNRLEHRKRLWSSAAHLRPSHPKHRNKKRRTTDGTRNVNKHRKVTAHDTYAKRRRNWQPTTARVGEASHPGPTQEQEQKHNIVIGPTDMEPELYNQVAGFSAKVRRDRFGAEVDKLTRTFQNATGTVKWAVTENTQPPHDYAKGPKPKEPTRIDKLVDTTEFLLSTLNTTTINGNKDLLTNIKGLTGIQEHQSPENIHGSFAKYWKNKGMNLGIGPPGTHTGHSSAGVAYQHDSSLITNKLKINTPAFQRAYDIGRVIHCAVIIDTKVTFTFTFYVAYGYTGGHGDPAQAKLTSNLVRAIDMENRSNGGGPAVLAIDLNANPTDIPHISERFMAKDHWTDAAGRASLWGGIDEQPTCNAPGAKATTRRAYIFAHPALARYISKVTTYNDGTFATRARVEVTFRFNGNKFLTRAATKITTIHYQ